MNSVRSEDTRVSAQVARLRATVLRRHGFDPADPIPNTVAESAVDEAARLSVVSAHWGIASETPVVGTVIVYLRRTMRIGLRWYINPIVEQQNAFNEAAVRALHELRAENDELRARLERLGSQATETEA